MKKLSFLLLTSALITLPSLAKAEFYAGVGGGVQMPREEGIKTGVKQNVDLDTGWGALGTVGYKFGNGFREELELSYRGTGVDNVSGTTSYGGSEHVYSLMANTLYDIDTGTIVTPYLGVGAGVAKVDYDNVRTIGGNTLNDSDVGLALQGIAGVSVPLAESLSFFTQYQYQNVINLETATNSGAGAKSQYGSSLITAGLRWEFSLPESSTRQTAMMEPVAAPEPALTPAPVAAPSETKKEVVAAPAVEKYMVFFDFNRSDLTIEAADILKKVADNAEKGKIVRLELTGHADRAGGDAYNMKLSQRRADAVKKQLVRLGLPAAEISTVAKGEREPLVPTADGVREPQNRRVEIVYGK